MTGVPLVTRVATGLRAPRHRIPGLDVCGTVVEVGERASRFRVGDDVFGVADGSLAEYAVADEDKLTRMPAGANPVHAAVTVESGLTALQALDAARVERGTRLLIIGASGGVGSFAVKLAVARGAHVTAVCSAAKAETVTGWGAHRVLDYNKQDPTAEDQQYDAVVEIGGGAPLSRLRRILEVDATLVFVGNEAGGVWTGGFGSPLCNMVRMMFRSQRYVLLTTRNSADDLQRLSTAIESGGLVPHVHDTWPLDEAAAAMAELASGAVCGKVAVLMPAPVTD